MAGESSGVPGGAKLLFAEHIEARQFGDHMRELRFGEPVVLHQVQILGRGEKPFPGSSFEGKTFPNVRTMSLNVFAADRAASASTMPKLQASEAGVFVPAERTVTDCLVIRGEFMKLSFVVYGHVPESGELPRFLEQDFAGVAAHLRPTAAFEADRLDLADHPESENDLESILEGLEASKVKDNAAPTSLARALALVAPTDVSARVLEHEAWVRLLPNQPDVLDSDAVVSRLESLAADLTTLARGVPDTSAAHIARGPELAQALLALIARCVERLELKQLRAALRALAAALCVAPTVAEVLKAGGLGRLLNILRDEEWCQLSHKLAALEALLQICSHAVGMEAFLGWSKVASEVDTGVTGTCYELVLALTLDAKPAHQRLARAALVLLKRAGFYAALARLDSSCRRFAEGGEDGDAETVKVLQDVTEALAEVATQLEELSKESAHELLGDEDSLLDIDCPSLFLEEGASPENGDAVNGKPGVGDPIAETHPQLHGFIESFIAGRRLISNLSLLLRRFPKLLPKDRLATFAPLRRLLCGLLACVGGPHFLATDAPALSTFLHLLEAGSPSAGAAVGKGGATGLPSECGGLAPVPRFPEPLARVAIGAPQLAALVAMHVRAVRLAFVLIVRTRQKGTDGVLKEEEALPLLCELHQLCAHSAAGRDSVVCAFRSVFLVEWLLRQLDNRLATAATMKGSGQASAAAALPQPSLRHLVAILHALVLGDVAATVADKFGSRVLNLASRTLELLDTSATSAESADGGSWQPGSTSLEFALDSDGTEGGLGRAVRIGRRSADATCRSQLNELIAQLRPWQQVEGEAAPSGLGELVSNGKLLSCLQIPRAPRAFKRSVLEERGHRFSLQLGGYTGTERGVEVAEVDFVGEVAAGERGADEQGEQTDEQLPSGSLTELPLLAMRLLCRRASRGAREAVEIMVADEKRTDGASASAMAIVVPVLIRSAAALSLNMDAIIVQDETEAIHEAFATQHAHLQLLEAALQTCYHILQGLGACGVAQYRHTDLLQALFMLAARLLSAQVGSASKTWGTDPEFRLLWRHCLVWVCRVYHVWVQNSPSCTGGQLVQPLLRFVRVLPSHFSPGLVLLTMCGSLAPLLPPIEYSFTLSPGKPAPESAGGEPTLSSRPLFFPVNTRGGALGHLSVRVAQDAVPPGRHMLSATARAKCWGQLWNTDWDAQEWDSAEGGDMTSGGSSSSTCGFTDPLVKALRRQPQTAALAQALGLVNRVNARRDRFTVDDLGELVSLVVQNAVTSDALLHITTVRVLDKLTRLGMPVLGIVLRMAEASLKGSSGGSSGGLTAAGGDAAAASLAAEGAPAAGVAGEGAAAAAASASWASAPQPPAGGATRDPRDARALSRILMLLVHFGRNGPSARRALVEQQAETLCLSVLAECSSSTTITQAIRVLGLVFCPQGVPGEAGGHGFEENGDGGKAGLERRPGTSALPVPKPKYRMVSKAVSWLINRQPEDGQALVGPATMSAALELLLRLSAMRNMCLNLLFSAEDIDGGAGKSTPLPVSVSCAFKLGHCAQRLARELAAADERWASASANTDDVAEAEESLAAWLHVGELLVNLCIAVLAHCPTVTVFLAVMLPGASVPDADKVDAAMLRSVLADVKAALLRITTRTDPGPSRRDEKLPLQAAAVSSALQALHSQLQEKKVAPPPTALSREELSTAAHSRNRAGGASGIVSALSGEEAGDDAGAEQGLESTVLADVVALFDDAAALEESAEWQAIAELDTTEPARLAAGAPSPPSASAGWEFDAVAHRKRRQAAMEKAEAERQAKRQKQPVAAQQRPVVSERSDDRSSRRRPAEGGGGGSDAPRAEKAARKEPEPAAPEAKASTADVASASKEKSSTAPTPTTSTAMVPASSVPSAAGKEAMKEKEAVTAFVKDHPEFMRVLQNPKKCLSDPRVKSMFLNELENYPVVKAFLASKGLVG